MRDPVTAMLSEALSALEDAGDSVVDAMRECRSHGLFGELKEIRDEIAKLCETVEKKVGAG